MSNEGKWYVVHTYAGYENKVKANIEKAIENRNMQDQIFEVAVPIQEVTEIKGGVKKIIPRKIFPGYVLLKMIMNDDTWYIVRNTRGVTSFVGPGSKPVALSEDEVKGMGIELAAPTVDLSIGEAIKVSNGPFENSIGTIKEISIHKKTVIVKLSLFGRETPVELDFTQIEKI